MKSEYLLVNKKILPDYFDDVLKCKELVEGKNLNISEACKICGISRSTYYKYKDYLFEVTKDKNQHAIIACRLTDKKGVLSQLLNTITAYHGNIITINQTIPINKIAYINLTLDIKDLSIDIGDLIKDIKELEGVKLVELLAVE